MHPNRTAFQKAATSNPPDYPTAFDMFNSLSMSDMLNALTEIGSAATKKLFEKRFSYGVGRNMPRMEYAMLVVMTRKLPLIAPGDLHATGQTSTAATFLGTTAPSKPQFKIQVLVVLTQSVTETSLAAREQKKMDDILAAQGGGFQLDVKKHPDQLAIGDIRTNDDIQRRRELVNPIIDANADRLVVLYGDLLIPGRRGETPSPGTRRTFSHIDTSSKGDDDATTVHEIGHATGLGHLEDEAKRGAIIWDSTNIMREVTGKRSTITISQGDTFVKAFFVKNR